jgi:amidase
LVGLKPTRGRIIDSPDLDKLPIKLPVQGVLTRSVRDTALYFAQAEKAYANPDLPPIGLVESPSSERLRIGMIRGGIRGLAVDAETTSALMSTALLLGRMGHHVDETAMPFADKFGNDFLRYWAMLAFTLRYGGSRVFGQGFDGTKTEQFTKGLARMFTSQAERMPLSIRRLRKAATDPDPMFENFDLVLTPVTGYPAPEIGYLGPDVDFRTHIVRLLQFSSFTPPQNVTGSPGISLPLGRTRDGRPIGVQLSAPRGQEARLLQVAYELEAAAPWQTHAPLTTAR